MGGLSHTVSGDIASFRTPSRVPIESLKFHFLPKQEGSGDPSPTNIRPITGWTGFKAYHEPAIYFFEQGGLADATGLPSGSQTSRIRTKDFIPCDTTIPKIIDGKSGPNDAVKAIYFYNSNKEFLGSQMAGTEKTFPFTYNMTILSSTAYIKIAMWHIDKNSDISPVGKWLIVKDDDQYANEVIFPTNGKNLVDDETTVSRGAPNNPSTVRNGRQYSNLRTDTRPEVQLYLQQIDDNNSIIKTNVLYTVTIGRNSITFNTVKGCKRLLFKHNGSTADIGIYIPWDEKLGTYTISANIESKNIAEVGGFVFSDVQIELGDTATAYEPYSSDNTFYGGYIDPVAGEIITEYAFYETTWGAGSTGTVLGDTKRKGFYVGSAEFADAIDLHNNGQGPYGKYRRTLCNIVPWGLDYFSDYPHYYINNHDINIMMPVDTPDNTVIQFCAWLKTPIHIPIPAEDMKAFLDHNNFWSDANDITEVTYAVTESKDILATRKKAMDFDMGHRRKVRWNQLARDISTSHWQMYSSNALRGTISDGIAECYYVTNKQYKRYSASVTTINSISWDADHYYYASYMVKPTYDGKFGIEFARGKQIQGMASVNANEWKRAHTKQKPQSTGFSGLYIPFPDPVGPIDEGYQVKAPFVVDLTLMFGAGNEPTTAAEFERICELNGIDLTTYQPYDEGSDRWLIVP